MYEIRIIIELVNSKYE